MDVKTAFLYGLIDQLVYIDIPRGFETEANQDMMCKLMKALHGLKQLAWLRYKRLSEFLLQKLGLAWIKADYSIFVTKADLHGPVLSTFVDDIKIMAPKESEITQRVKTELTTAFSMVDIGPISFYLRLKVERNWEKRIIKLSQPAYINTFVSKFYLNKAHTTTTLNKESTILQPCIEGQATTAEKKR